MLEPKPLSDKIEELKLPNLPDGEELLESEQDKISGGGMNYGDDGADNS